jgi:hypothetical protein
MHKVLYVGDPHAKPNELEEMEGLTNYICDVARTEGVQYICLLGDLFHTHSVIHSPVMAFWESAFRRMTAVAEVYVIVGNHDMSGRDGDRSNALMLYSMPRLTIVDHPQLLPWGAVGVPYLADRDSMPVWTHGFKDLVQTVVCHQTFTGSKYENGFYAHDGVDPDLIPQNYIISGHIHSPQEIGKVWYPGAPRWQIVTDANTERHIWVVEHAADGTPTTKRGFSTAGVCKPIWLLEDSEDVPVNLQGRNGAIIIDVHGSEAYTKRRRVELEALGVRVRTFPNVERRAAVKESEGIPKAFLKYVQAFKPKHETPVERILDLARQRLGWFRGEA